MSDTPDTNRPVPDPAETFRTATRDRLPALGTALLRLEDHAGDAATANFLAQEFQFLGQAAQTAGLSLALQLCEGCAQVLAEVQAGRAYPSTMIIDLLLQGCDRLGQDQKAEAEEVRRWLEQLTAVLAEGRVTTLPQPRDPPATPSWPDPGHHLSPELIEAFVGEAADHLSKAEMALLALEKEPGDAEAINHLFRSVHSIKGTADFVGLAQMKTLSHRLENVLELARAGQMELNPAVVDLLLRGVDELKNMIHDLAPDGEADHQPAELLAASRRSQGFPGGFTRGGLAQDRPDSPRGGVPAIGHDAARLYPELSACRGGGRLLRRRPGALRDALATLVNAAAYMGRADVVEPSSSLLQAVDSFRHTQTRLKEQLTALLGDRTSTAVAPPSPPQPMQTTPPRASNSASRPAPEMPAAPRGREAPNGSKSKLANQTMRIDQHKLDEYVNLAGELVIARNALSHVFRQFQTDRGHLRHLKDSVDKVHRIVADIQNNAMSMRMVPVSTLFQRFPAHARDLARSQGKKIELQMFGEETELDKQVVEALGDPLVHLLRNSADHGIESPQARQAAGKDETGTITLRAAREGNSIVIDVLDDGAGIDLERLKRKAIDKGLLRSDQAAALARQEALELIFAPGLSTAEKVTDVSGRGVGMDVVRSNVVALGGSVSVSTEEGKGTTLRLQLPLTLAVSNVILCAAASRTYALPMECVKETVKVMPTALKRLKGQYAVALRGEVVPLKSLTELLGLRERKNGSSCPFLVDESGRIPIMVITAGEALYGVIVDELKGQQEMVIKPLPGALAHLPGLGGATITGDGSVVLILDPNSLYELARLSSDR